MEQKLKVAKAKVTYYIPFLLGHGSEQDGLIDPSNAVVTTAEDPGAEASDALEALSRHWKRATEDEQSKFLEHLIETGGLFYADIGRLPTLWVDFNYDPLYWAGLSDEELDTEISRLIHEGQDVGKVIDDAMNERSRRYHEEWLETQKLEEKYETEELIAAVNDKLKRSKITILAERLGIDAESLAHILKAGPIDATTDEYHPQFMPPGVKYNLEHWVSEKNLSYRKTAS